MRCDADLLWTLVEQNEEPGDNAEPIAEHLESCTDVTAKQSVGPYIIRASQQIDSAVSIDDLQFQSELNQINQQLRRLRHVDPAIGIPSIYNDDADWNRKFSNLEKLINAQPSTSPQ